MRRLFFAVVALVIGVMLDIKTKEELEDRINNKMNLDLEESMNNQHYKKILVAEVLLQGINSGKYYVDLEEVKQYAVSRFKLQSSAHGMRHWKQVEKNGLMLAECDPQVNKRVVVLFAYLHDCERRNE